MRYDYCINYRTCRRKAVLVQKVERTTSRTGSVELASAKHLDSDPFTTPVSAILVDMIVTLGQSTNTLCIVHGSN